MSTQTSSAEVEPQAGLFFYPETAGRELVEAKDWYSYSQAFSDSSSDFLPGDGNESAMVLQYVHDSYGNIVKTDDEDAVTKPKTVQFLATEGGTYYWSLTEANSKGRRVHTIIVGQVFNAGNYVDYDIQGRQSGSGVLGDEQIDETMQTVFTATQSGLFSYHRALFLKSRKEALEKIADFEVTGREKYAPEKFNRLMEHKYRALRSIGYISLGLKEIDATPQSERSQIELESQTADL